MKVDFQLEPHFKHDCDACKFIDHINGFDVYVCHRVLRNDSTIIARYGNEGHEYFSNDISLFRNQIIKNEYIGGKNDDGSDWMMKFRDYLVSDKVIDYHKADRKSVV